MSGVGKCAKHDISSSDAEWKVLLEEMTEGDEGSVESFSGEVCPQCFLHLKDKYVKARRQLKVESRNAIELRQQNEFLRSVVEAVVATVKKATGKDALKLAKEKYEKSPRFRMEMPFTMEQGDLRNILPNLVTEAVSAARRSKK